MAYSKSLTGKHCVTWPQGVRVSGDTGRRVEKLEMVFGVSQKLVVSVRLEERDAKPPTCRVGFWSLRV
jgi:hypothetical protein